ncbi:MAG: hypothetical protein R6U96_11815 [Promethearchaeia archaeon]
MTSILTWFKKEVVFLKDSIPLILKACVLFLLIFSGLGISIFLRVSGFNGVIISLGGIVVEALGIIVLYFFLNGYFQQVEKEKRKKVKGKKK